MKNRQKGVRGEQEKKRVSNEERIIPVVGKQAGLDHPANARASEATPQRSGGGLASGHRPAPGHLPGCLGRAFKICGCRAVWSGRGEDLRRGVLICRSLQIKRNPRPLATPQRTGNRTAHLSRKCPPQAEQPGAPGQEIWADASATG